MFSVQSLELRQWILHMRLLMIFESLSINILELFLSVSVISYQLEVCWECLAE